MSRATITRCLVLVFVLTFTLAGCLSSKPQLQESLTDYTKIVTEDIPDNFRLTIYYLDPRILTRAPLSTEDLIEFPDTKVIVVDSEDLAMHTEVLRKLDWGDLQPAKESSYLNARLYYVFDIGDSGKVLEVAISSIHGSVFVNGIEVEDHPIFYELIAPFLTEDAQSTLAIG